MPEQRQPLVAPDVRSRRRRAADLVLILLVPAILIGVAIHQITLAHTADLTPWKGGGFGMFASPDRHNHRAMRGYFETDEERVPVDVYSLWHQTEGSDHKAFVNARALPDARRMDQWAAVVAAAEWEIVDGVGVFLDWREEPVSNDLSVTLYSGDEARSIEVHSFSMQVWGATYMRTSQEITPRLIAEHHYPAGTSR